MKILSYFFCFLILLLFNAPLTLTASEFPRWKNLYEEGLTAAKSKDWQQAITKFKLALDETGPNPTTVFNLALANANNGDVIQAAIWFRTYLVMIPDAKNAATIGGEIRRLDGEILKGSNELFERAIAAARLLPSVKNEGWLGPKKVEALGWIELAAAVVGNQTIAEQAKDVARKVAEELEYEYSPSAYEDQSYEKFDDVGDMIAIVGRKAKYKDEKAYFLQLAYAIRNLARTWPDVALKYILSIPENQIVKFDTYLQSGIIGLVLEHGNRDEIGLFEKYRWDKQFLWSQSKRAEELLFAGKTVEARAIANRVRKIDNKNAVAEAVMGNSKKPLRIIYETPGNPFDLLFPYVETANIAGILLMVDNHAGIKRAIKQAVKLGDENEFTSICRFYLDIAGGKLESAIKRFKSTERGSDWYLQSVNNTFAKAIRNAVRYLIIKKRLEGAQLLVAKIARPVDQLDLMEEIAIAMERSGQDEDASNIRTEAEILSNKIYWGWNPKSREHENKIKNWYAAAKGFEFNGDSVRNLQLVTANALKSKKTVKDSDAEEIVYALHAAGEAWGEALMRLNALDKLDPESVTWK